ncbi:uncharacterized protein LOC126628941 [Malus sylvestris]|uniref:uncharacterized protein LOC126628941 n=1 Tax=Malus sylvestris TaxID=3752 RepID=UPI0021AD2B82|nr:uncharacterized protein LOC126628941 [Malus sylvestris]
MLVGEGVVCDAIPICRSDPHNCQTLAEIGSSSIRVGEGVVCDAIPIFRSEFTADHLENNLLDSEKQLEALRQSCSIPRSVGIRLVRCEELPSKPPTGHVMFYTQTLVTLGVNLPLHPWLQRMLSFIGYAPGQLNPGFWDTLIGFYIIWMECGLGEPFFHQWRYCYKMRPVKACTGYAECACRSERERVVFDKRKAYCTWKKHWCFLYNDWEHAKGVTPERRVPTHFQTVVTRGTIKLSGQELADVEKVLRVPKEDRHLGKLRPLFRKYGFQPLVSECQRRAMEKVGKKVETSTKKMRVPMLVPSEDILFHKEAHKHRVRPIIKTKSREEVIKVAVSKKAEAIGCAAAIVAGEDRRLLPPLPTINPIFPPVREHIGQEGDPSSSSKGKDKEEVGSVPWKDLKVAMRPKDFGYINNCLAGCQFTFDELGEPLAKDESDCDRMLKLSSYVMAEYHDRLREAERCKVKLKENKQLVNDARKTSKALAEAIEVRDQHFESLKRRNGENLRLKVQLEATKKQLETTMLEVSKAKGELDSALVEVSELKSSIPTEKEAAVKEFFGSPAFLHVLRPRCTREVHFEKRKWMAVLDRYDDGSVLRKYREEIDEHHRKGETFNLAVYSSSADESGDEASADEQSHQGDDEFGNAENGGRTHNDMIRGSTSDEDD